MKVLKKRWGKVCKLASTGQKVRNRVTYRTGWEHHS